MKIELRVSDKLAGRLAELVDDETVAGVTTIETAALWALLLGMATRQERKRKLAQLEAELMAEDPMSSMSAPKRRVRFRCNRCDNTTVAYADWKNTICGAIGCSGIMTPERPPNEGWGAMARKA